MAIEHRLVLFLWLGASAAVTQTSAPTAESWSGHESGLASTPAPRMILSARLEWSQESSQDKPPKPQPKPVAGCVKDRDGALAKRAPVVITRADTRIETYTNEMGCFSFTGIDGAYKITIKVDEKTETFDAMIANGQLNPNEFTMK